MLLILILLNGIDFGLNLNVFIDVLLKMKPMRHLKRNSPYSNTRGVQIYLTTFRSPKQIL